MDEIEQKYHDIEQDFYELHAIAEQELLLALKLSEHEEDEAQNIFTFLNTTKLEMLNAITKAKCYDIERFKKSQGGKLSAKKLSKAERIERARKAGSVKKGERKTEQKPSRNRTKTEQV